MNCFLGIDTSNYTTSVALYDRNTGEMRQEKKLLPVKEGERGLRQSDAVFHHTCALPELLEKLLIDSPMPDCIGVSTRPEDREGSYMPCFLVGEGAARAIAAAKKIPLHSFSHQQGHIAAALYSANRLDLLKESFYAFHVSGGTTQLLFVSPSDSSPFTIERISASLDLKAGQAIDRIGVRLGYDFPAGRKLDDLSLQSDRSYFKGSGFKLKDGNCSLSGLENQAGKMLLDGEDECDIACFVFDSIASALYSMYLYAVQLYGEKPVLFSGGVTSNTLIRRRLRSVMNGVFAEPDFSRDNAAGAALLSYLEEK